MNLLRLVLALVVTMGVPYGVGYAEPAPGENEISDLAASVAGDQAEVEATKVMLDTLVVLSRHEEMRKSQALETETAEVEGPGPLAEPGNSLGKVGQAVAGLGSLAKVAYLMASARTPRQNASSWVGVSAGLIVLGVGSIASASFLSHEEMEMKPVEVGALRNDYAEKVAPEVAFLGRVLGWTADEKQRYADALVNQVVRQRVAAHRAGKAVTAEAVGEVDPVAILESENLASAEQIVALRTLRDAFRRAAAVSAEDRPEVAEEAWVGSLRQIEISESLLEAVLRDPNVQANALAFRDGRETHRKAREAKARVLGLVELGR